MSTSAPIGPVHGGYTHWTCAYCGAQVPNGCTHSCPTGVFPTFLESGDTPLAKWVNPYEMTLQRIAVALERIADALADEGRAGEIPPGLEGPLDPDYDLTADESHLNPEGC